MMTPSQSERTHLRGPAARLVEALQLERIPDEGPWFALTYRSPDLVAGSDLPARYGGAARAAGSAILGLQTATDFSALHRLRTDELWHYYGGQPLEMLLLWADGRGERKILGPEVLAGQSPQLLVPQGTWQGSRPMGDEPERYTLFGCTLAPGFDYGDFEMGYGGELQAQYPDFADFVADLTRPEFRARPAGATPAPAPMAAPAAFPLSAVPPQALGPGLALRELIGRSGQARAETHSVAHFHLAPGQATPMSYNQGGEETFLIVRGEGIVTLDGVAQPVGPGSTVVIKPKLTHALAAGPAAPLEFYALTVPAFSPRDYVAVPAP